MENSQSTNVESNPWSINTHSDQVDKDLYAKEHKEENIPLVNNQLGKIDKFNYSNNLQNLRYILQDVLAGDKAALENPLYKSLNIPAIVSALNWLTKTNQFSDRGKLDLLANAWRLNFKRKPPTINEFLTRKYIGLQADSLNNFVKNTLLEFYDTSKPYRDLVISLCTGAGKALTLDEKVWIDENNYKLNGDLKVGDKILSADGKSQQEIKAIADWDTDEIYELKLETGKKIKCGQHHLHHISYRKDKNNNPIWEDVETLFIVNNPEFTYKFQTFLNKKINILTLKSIKYIGTEKSRCIEVSDKSGLYVAGDKIITHNSTLTILSNLFIACHLGLMWHPYKFFNGAPSSTYVLALASWSDKKASELYAEPLMQVISQSPYFKAIRRSDDMDRIDKCILEGKPFPANLELDENEDCLPYTTATKTSVCKFAGNLVMKGMSSVGGQMGLNIVHASFSELSFFIDEGGWSNDKIWQFFTKTKERVGNRMMGNYYGRTILDSSPNNMDSVIDDYIWHTAGKEPTTLVKVGSRWAWFPEEFSKFIVNGKEIHNFNVAFPFYKGGNGSPPKVIETEAELTTFPKVDIIWCPKEQITAKGTVFYKGKALANPVEFMRDNAGIPAGTAERILYMPHWVEDIFKNKLKNIFSTISAPKEDNPEHLIWDQIKDKFFNKILGKYYFYYEPSLPRVASVDLAISGDTASLSISHVERDSVRTDSEGNPLKVYITDLVIPVIPKGGMINLDAFKFAILDLINLGNMNIKHVSFDSFQSRAMMQSLERYGIAVDYISVDKDNKPYLSLIDYIQHNRYYCGKSIMVKNNLLALQTIKRKITGSIKIDHSQGDNIYIDQYCPLNAEYSDLAWEESKVGDNAKDTTDTIAANIALLDEYDTEYIPNHVFKPWTEVVKTYDSEKEKVLELRTKLGF